MQHANDATYVKNLVEKYRSGSCTPQEARELLALLEGTSADEELENSMRRHFQEMFPDTTAARTPVIGMAKKWAVAATLLALLVTGILLWVSYRQPSPVPMAQQGKSAGQSTTAGTILKTTDGQSFLLDSVPPGQITRLPGARVMADGEGGLVFEADGRVDAAEVITNTISTPAGGFLRIQLPDQTIVWLNAQSQVTFPSQFEEDQRAVQLSGEAFFEVAENTKKPFSLQLQNGHRVEVVGTAFNVMAYGNEPAQKITLVEGSIRFIGSGGTLLLKPGEQVVAKNGGRELRKGVNVEHEMAWKEGLFDFEDEDLGYILRQMERWYGVQVVYQAREEQAHYTGAIRRSSHLREVLKMLELAGNVQFTIVGNQIVVNDKKSK